MTNKQTELKMYMERAIECFNHNESHLLDRNLSERCVCAKFAVYLEKELQNSRFSDYYVDVEYNRGMDGNEYAKKRLLGHDATVDIIVHKREHKDEEGGFNNLICIEMKKRGGEKHLFWDKQRLQALISPYDGFNYRIGFMLIARRKGIKINEIFCNPQDF